MVTRYLYFYRGFMSNCLEMLTFLSFVPTQKICLYKSNSEKFISKYVFFRHNQLLNSNNILRNVLFFTRPFDCRILRTV